MSWWMKSLHIKRVLLGGLSYFVIATVIRQAEVALTMGYYTNPAYSELWSKLMMPVAGPPPLAFFVTSLFFTLATGCTLAAVFEFMHGLFGKGFWHRVIGFTDIMVGLMIVFGFFPMYLMFNVPLGLVVWWFVTGWVTILVAAIVLAKIIK